MDDFTIQRIKDAASIVDVVGAYVQLKRKGKDYLGLCPFHNDRHLGSFVVSPSRGTYHCFACEAGGDAISFVQKMEHVDFIKACQILGDRYGIPTDSKPDKSYQPKMIRPLPRPDDLPPLELPASYVTAKEKDIADDTLVKWLRSLPWDDGQRENLRKVLKNFCVGHARQGHTIFWQIGADCKIRTAKMMLYKPDGHRDRETPGNFAWVHNMLARHGLVNLDATPYKTCYFGEHLINYLNADATVCVVESEKTAIICNTYWGMSKRMIWIACGGMTYLTRERLQPLMDRHLYIALYPDHDGIDKWTARMREIIRATNYDRMSIQSDFVCKYWRKADGQKADIADILVRQLTSPEAPKPKEQPRHERVDNLRAELDATFARMRAKNPALDRLANTLGLEPVKFL